MAGSGARGGDPPAHTVAEVVLPEAHTSVPE